MIRPPDGVALGIGDGLGVRRRRACPARGERCDDKHDRRDASEPQPLSG